MGRVAKPASESQEMQQVCPCVVNTITLTLALTLLRPRTHAYLQDAHVSKKLISASRQRRNQQRHLIGHPGICSRKIFVKTQHPGVANRPLWINTGTLCVSYLTKDVSKDEDADNHAEKSGEAFSENDLGLGVDVWCA